MCSLSGTERHIVDRWISQDPEFLHGQQHPRCVELMQCAARGGGAWSLGESLPSSWRSVHELAFNVPVRGASICALVLRSIGTVRRASATSTVDVFASPASSTRALNGAARRFVLLAPFVAKVFACDENPERDLPPTTDSGVLLLGSSEAKRRRASVGDAPRQRPCGTRALRDDPGDLRHSNRRSQSRRASGRMASCDRRKGRRARAEARGSRNAGFSAKAGGGTTQFPGERLGASHGQALFPVPAEASGQSVRPSVCSFYAESDGG